MLGNFSYSCRLLIFFKNNFIEKKFQEYHQSVKRFDADQDQGSVWPDMGLNWLQKISADDKNHLCQGKPCPY